MFSGIIEEIGLVSSIKSNNNSMSLVIKAKSVLADVKLGDSIAINGVCLTVTRFTKAEFSVDVMPETYQATTLSTLKVGLAVNLESSLRFNAHIGGHFVTGHVDGVGKIKSITKSDNALDYIITIDSELVKYCIHKGSIAVDGTSLTIFRIVKNDIYLSLIPHTVQHSVIGRKVKGDLVNIECDMLGKYIINMTSQTMSNQEVIQDKLNRSGYIK